MVDPVARFFNSTAQLFVKDPSTDKGIDKGEGFCH